MIFERWHKTDYFLLKLLYPTVSSPFAFLQFNKIMIWFQLIPQVKVDVNRNLANVNLTILLLDRHTLSNESNNSCTLDKSE